MTPESLSREGSPSPAGEITLHAAPGVTGHGGVLSASVPASSVVQAVAVEQMTGGHGLPGQNAINQIVGAPLEIKTSAINGGSALAVGNPPPRMYTFSFISRTLIFEYTQIEACLTTCFCYSFIYIFG